LSNVSKTLYLKVAGIYPRTHTQLINLNLSQDQLISKWVNTTDFDGSNMFQEKDHGLELVRYKALQDLGNFRYMGLIVNSAE